MRMSQANLLSLEDSLLIFIRHNMDTIQAMDIVEHMRGEKETLCHHFQQELKDGAAAIDLSFMGLMRLVSIIQMAFLNIP